MTYRRFISWTAPACAIWATAYVTVGWVVGGSFRALQEQLHFAGYLFVARDRRVRASPCSSSRNSSNDARLGTWKTQ